MATPGITTKTDEAKPFKGQNYRELKKECLQKERLFEDPVFEASLQSLGYDSKIDKTKAYPKLSWKRPKDICKDEVPHFIKNGMDLLDVQQQKLGDCWFLAAVACLTLRKDLLCKVVPQDQSFAKGEYAGIFHFKFCNSGQWVDVVVDDRLPVLDGKLYFAGFPKISDGKDFWMPLLEKAYAKFNGSYRAIIGGHMCHSFVHLTGGIPDTIYPEKDESRFFETIEMAVKRKSLLGAVTKELKGIKNGLVHLHAYSILDIKKFNHGGKEVKLLRLRNPWGCGEWNGRWSDKSKVWSELQPELQKQLNVQNNEGEFWIELDDFKQNFRQVDICHLNSDTLKKKGVDGR